MVNDRLRSNSARSSPSSNVFSKTKKTKIVKPYLAIQIDKAGSNEVAQCSCIARKQGCSPHRAKSHKIGEPVYTI